MSADTNNGQVLANIGDLATATQQAALVGNIVEWKVDAAVSFHVRIVDVRRSYGAIECRIRTARRPRGPLGQGLLSRKPAQRFRGQVTAMRITINGARFTPKWETVQDLIRQATGDESALLVRIARDDKGCAYREPGTYTLGVAFHYDTNPTTVTLEVTR